MMRLTSRRAALVLAGTTLALTAGILPAQAGMSAGTGWRAEATVAIKGKSAVLTSIDAVSARDAWAAGFAATGKGKSPVGLVEHWSGKAWRPVTLPASVARKWNAYSATDLPVIGASSGTNVWAFAELPVSEAGDGYIRLNGRKWTVATLPGSSLSTGNIVVVCATTVVSSTDVWVFGGQAAASSPTATFSPYAAQFNGKRWKTYSVPGTGAITAASEVSSGNIWAVLGVPSLLTSVATAAPPALVRWNGSSWATVQPGLTVLPVNANLTSVLASSGGDVWVGGGAANADGGTSEFTAELSDSAWTLGNLSAPESSADFALIDLVPDGSGGVWGLAGNDALGKPRLWHLTSSSTTWTSASTSFGGSRQVLFQLAEVPGSQSVWGVGAVQHGSAVDGLVALYGATP